jgi:hypothetical protein
MLFIEELVKVEAAMFLILSLGFTSFVLAG